MEPARRPTVAPRGSFATLDGLTEDVPMGYFDALAESSFKQTDGSWCFYPYGVLGRGYVIPTEQEHLEIRSFVKRAAQTRVPLVVVAALFGGWLWGLLLLSVVAAWYVVKVGRIVRLLEAARGRVTLGESYRAKAGRHTGLTLWLLEIACAGFALFGIVLLVRRPDEWRVTAPSVGICSAFAIALGYMLALRGDPRQ